MKPQLLEVKRDRFDLQNDQVYLLQGNWPKGYDLKAYLDTTELPAGKEPWESESALERFTESEMINGEKVTVRVTLPEEISSGKRLYVYACAGSERRTWYEVSVRELEKKWKKPQYYIEEEQVDTKENTLKIRGWAVDRNEVKVLVYDRNKKKNFLLHSEDRASGCSPDVQRMSSFREKRILYRSPSHSGKAGLPGVSDKGAEGGVPG